MGYIEKRGQDQWKARYRTPDGQVRSKNFRRKVDADRFLVTQEADKVRGAWVDPAAGRQKVGDYVKVWRQAQVWRESTQAQVDSHLKRNILPTFGDRPLAAVRPSEVQTWVRGLSEKLAPATVEVCYRYLVSIFRAAEQDRLIAHSPCVKVKLPRIERQQVDPLEVAQVEALADAMPDRYRALIVLAAGTGLRQGEAFGLTVPAVDFLRRRLTVDRQMVLVGGKPPHLGPPKTQASYRAVPLPDVVLEALAHHVEQYGTGAEDLIFTNVNGDPIRRTRFSEIWRPAVKRAGLPKGTRFHSLRHFYASLLIRHGESVKVVQSRLGHASAAETLDTYSHLWPDSEDTTRAAVDAVLGNMNTTGRKLA